MKSYFLYLLTVKKKLSNGLKKSGLPMVPYFPNPKILNRVTPLVLPTRMITNSMFYIGRECKTGLLL